MTAAAQPTKRQANALNKIFGKFRLADAALKVCGDIIEITFPEGRKDKVRVTETGLMLGHWRNV